MQASNIESIPSEFGHEFRFIEFNERRHARRVEAVRMETEYGWLWMSKSDIQKNIKELDRTRNYSKHLNTIAEFLYCGG